MGLLPNTAVAKLTRRSVVEQRVINVLRGGAWIASTKAPSRANFQTASAPSLTDEARRDIDHLRQVAMALAFLIRPIGTSYAIWDELHLLALLAQAQRVTHRHALVRIDDAVRLAIERCAADLVTLCACLPPPSYFANYLVRPERHLEPQASILWHGRV